MSMFVSSMMFIVLLAVSMAHFLWSIGKTWPIRDEKLLAQTVVGFQGVERMPPRPASFAVCALTLLAGILALALADRTAGGIWLTLLGVPFAAVFLARGIAGYTAWWAQLTPELSFRFNDKRVYSPLCIGLGLGFLILVVLRLI
jgi:hypothetical protein